MKDDDTRMIESSRVTSRLIGLRPARGGGDQKRTWKSLIRLDPAELKAPPQLDTSLRARRPGIDPARASRLVNSVDF